MKEIKWLALVSVVCLSLASGCSSGEKGPASSRADTTASAVSTKETELETTGTADSSEADITVSAPPEGTATTKRPPAPQTTASAVTKKPTTTTKKPTTTSTSKVGPRPTLPEPAGSQSINSLTYKTPGNQRIGDWGGPAYTVYSQKGYNRVSMDIALSEVKINMLRKSDKKTLVGYAFLGMDIHDPAGGYWVNCLDAGIKYDGIKGKWVLFHFIYDVSAPNQPKWYESYKGLDPTHDYRLSLDCSKSDGWTTLAAYDLTEGREADSIMFQARYAKKDGSNVSFYQDFAIDMPEDVTRDHQGNVYKDDGTLSDEVWEKIILYNTDEDVYIRNMKITNSCLNGKPWTADKTRLRGFSPDTRQTHIDYQVVRVSRANFDNEFRIDIDMNR